jgi:trigger factor
MTMEDYLEGSGQTMAAIEEEFASDARRSVKAGFILDKIASDEKIGIESAELDAYVTQQAYQMGVAPQQLAKQLTDSGQLSHVVSDVLRSKALTLITERATVTDDAGNTVDVAAVIRGEDGESGEDGEGDEGDADTAGAETAGEARAEAADAADAADAAPAKRRSRTTKPKESREAEDKPARAPRARRAKAKAADSEATESEAGADQA